MCFVRENDILKLLNPAVRELKVCLDWKNAIKKFYSGINIQWNPQHITYPLFLPFGLHLQPLVNYLKRFTFFELSLFEVILDRLANLHIPFFIQRQPVYGI